MKIFKLITLVLLLIFAIGYALVEYVRQDNSTKYHAMAKCEENELAYCKENFDIGISYTNFKRQLIQKNIKNPFEWDEKDIKLISIQNILEKCPESGRQYCGVTFEFKKKYLTEIYAGYPCH